MSDNPYKRLKQSVTEQVSTLQREAIEKQNKQKPLNKSPVKIFYPSPNEPKSFLAKYSFFRKVKPLASSPSFAGSLEPEYFGTDVQGYGSIKK